MEQLDLFFYIVVAIIFVATVLLFGGIFSLWNSNKSPEAIRLNERLRSVADSWIDTSKASFLKQRALSESAIINSQLQRIPNIHKLDQLLIQSDSSIKVSGFLFYTAVFSILGAFIAFILDLHIFFIILAALGFALLPLIYIIKIRNNRLKKMEEQLPEAIDLMARALKAGHAFSGALQMVGKEGMEPISKEFNTTFEEVNYGIPMQDALLHFSLRVPLMDIRYFIIAVMIQRESGGNLAELLENISNLIRERLKLLGKIRVLSAEGKLSAWILGCLPFALAGVIQIVNPGYLTILYTDPVGYILIGGMVILMSFGVFIMSRIIKIRV